MGGVQWRPGPRVAAALGVGGLLWFGLALYAYGGLYLSRHDGDGSLPVQGLVGALAGLLLTALLSGLVLVVHELLHALVFRLLGHRVAFRPRSGLFASLVEVVEPAYVSRAGFVVATLTPVVVLGAAAAAAVLWAPYGEWWIVPGAAGVAHSSCDVATAAVAAGLRPGARVQPTVSGLVARTAEPGPDAVH